MCPYKTCGFFYLKNVVRLKQFPFNGFSFRNAYRGVYRRDQTCLSPLYSMTDLCRFRCRLSHDYLQIFKPSCNDKSLNEIGLIRNKQTSFFLKFLEHYDLSFHPLTNTCSKLKGEILYWYSVVKVKNKNTRTVPYCIYF